MHHILFFSFFYFVFFFCNKKAKQLQKMFVFRLFSPCWFIMAKCFNVFCLFVCFFPDNYKKCKGGFKGGTPSAHPITFAGKGHLAGAATFLLRSGGTPPPHWNLLDPSLEWAKNHALYRVWLCDRIGCAKLCKLMCETFFFPWWKLKWCVGSAWM